MGTGETSSKSFLFAMFHGGGNVHLIMPVVGKLAARGHRVRVLAGPRLWVPRPPPTTPLLDAVTRAGATAITLPTPSANPHDTAPARRGLLMGWTPGRLSRGRNLGTASWWAPVWADAMAAELAREPPDVAVADHYLLGAIAAAERAGIPTAVLVHNAMYPGPVRGLPPPGAGFGPERFVGDRLRDRAWGAALRWVATREALPSLNHARANLGLNRLASPFDQYAAAARMLILSSRSFDFTSDGLPSNVPGARDTGTGSRCGDLQASPERQTGSIRFARGRASQRGRRGYAVRAQHGDQGTRPWLAACLPPTRR